jgi:hypothetical protein
MLRVIGRELIADLDRTLLFFCMNLDEDCANLTRLNDFFEVKVACLTSAGSCAKARRSRDGWLVWTPHRRLETSRRRDHNPESRLLTKLKRLAAIIPHRKVLLELFAGEDFAKVFFSWTDFDFRAFDRRCFSRLK